MTVATRHGSPVAFLPAQRIRATIAFALLIRLAAPASLLLAPGTAAAQSRNAMNGPVTDSARASAITRPVKDLGGAVATLGRDFWLTFSAPVRMDHDAWLATAGVLGAGGLLYLVDDDITRAALRNEDAPVLKQILDAGTFLEPIGLMGNTNIWYAAGAVTSYAVGWDRPKRLFTELLYSHWIAAVIRGATNRVVGRARPHDGLGATHFSFGGGTSFPSGHASTLFQVAAVLSHHADWMPATIALYGLAGAGAWERIASEQHWASDVWLGAAYGWAVAKLVIRLHENDAIRLEPDRTGLGIILRIPF
jgi:membrane-associated phospholipid phosphatase